MMWYDLLMITTLLSLLLACSPQQHISNPDRRDWELYAPALDQTLHLPITITWSADRDLVHDLTVSAADWRRHLSCGIELVQVEKDADVSFDCKDFEIVPNVEARSLDFPGNGHISVHPAACSRGGNALATHAWGHALGFQHREEWFDTRMSAVGIVLEQMHGIKVGKEWDPVESDGYRIWALRNGAPGCGADELPWSWVEHPDNYDELPTQELQDLMLSLSDLK